MRPITVLSLILFMPVVALAQTEPPLTAEAAVELALRQNPRLTAVAHDVAAARAGVRAAGALANPELTFTPSVLGTGGSDEELLFRQPLELNGARAARKGVARAQLRQTEAEAVGELRALVYETKAAYFELVRTRELLSVAQQTLASAEEFDRITRRQVDVGTRPALEQTQTSIEVVRARQQVTLAEAGASAALVLLNTLMGRPAAVPTGPLPPLAPVLAETPNRDAAIQQALGVRTEVAAEAARQDQFREQARLARTEGLPDVAPQLRAGRVTRGLSDTGVGLGITLPFIDYGRRRNQVRQAEEEARAQGARIIAAQNRVRQEVEQASAHLAAAERVVHEYQAGVLEQSRLVVEGSRKGYEAGLTSVAAVFEAQRTYRSVLTDYANALVDLALARAQLERATGAVPANLLPAATDERRAK